MMNSAGGASMAAGDAFRLKNTYGIVVKPLNAGLANQSTGGMTLVVEQIEGAVVKKSLGKEITDAFDNLDNLLRVPDLKILDIAGSGYTLNEIVAEATKRGREDGFQWKITSEEIECFTPPRDVQQQMDDSLLQYVNWDDGHVAAASGSPRSPRSRSRTTAALGEDAGLPPNLKKERGMRTLILDVRVGAHQHTVEIGPCHGQGLGLCRRGGCTGVRDLWKHQTKHAIWPARNGGENDQNHPPPMSYGDDCPIIPALMSAHGFLAPSPGMPAMTDLAVQISLLLWLDKNHHLADIDIRGKKLGPGDMVLVGNWLKSSGASDCICMPTIDRSHSYIVYTGADSRPGTPGQTPEQSKAKVTAASLQQQQSPSREVSRTHSFFARSFTLERLDADNVEVETDMFENMGAFNAVSLKLSDNPGILSTPVLSREEELRLKDLRAKEVVEDSFGSHYSAKSAALHLLAHPLEKRRLVLNSWR